MKPQLIESLRTHCLVGSGMALVLFATLPSLRAARLDMERAGFSVRTTGNNPYEFLAKLKDHPDADVRCKCVYHTDNAVKQLAGYHPAYTFIEEAVNMTSDAWDFINAHSDKQPKLFRQ